jgi:hypothetical protein
MKKESLVLDHNVIFMNVAYLIPQSYVTVSAFKNAITVNVIIKLSFSA